MFTVKLTQDEALIIDDALAALVKMCDPKLDAKLLPMIERLGDRLRREATEHFSSPAVLICLHEDPGHRWGEVPIQLLGELGIADKISQYSYRHGNQAFLEEDVDLAELCVALDKANRRFLFSLAASPAPVRTYKRYK